MVTNNRTLFISVGFKVYRSSDPFAAFRIIANIWKIVDYVKSHEIKIASEEFLWIIQHPMPSSSASYLIQDPHHFSKQLLNGWFIVVCLFVDPFSG